MEDNKRIIEINGVKLEIDMRSAKTIENYKVGDAVKLLRKNYGENFVPHIAVIVGFDEFEKHPTIIVAYLKIDYSGASIEFEYINSESKDVEICPLNQWDIPFSKQTVIDKMDKEIAKLEESIRDIKSKRNYFLNQFGQFFEGKV